MHAQYAPREAQQIERVTLSQVYVWQQGARGCGAHRSTALRFRDNATRAWATVVLIDRVMVLVS